MARIKMKYGIDLGTTNSAISYVENGEAVIRKTETQKDTLPSCVSIRKKTDVGDRAYNNLRSDRCKATKMRVYEPNVHIEFKRTMGNDTKYHFSQANVDMNSEQLSAEVLKALKSLITEENFSSAVITIPAKFKADQIAATKRAATLAGITHCELLQEPVAAALAYGLRPDSGGGNWLVFDFGGGTFDSALLKVEDGIIQVKDTEGDNYLGGKNLDYAIVDEIIIPHLKANFSIDGILKDNAKRQILRDAMKYYAEQAKNELSFREKTSVTSELDEFGDDDNGEPIELDLDITREQLRKVVTPIYQKAVDISKNLLSRNGLSGGSLDALILVGGPTLSPILRDMVREQVTPNVRTEIDPMTAVAKGAAIYASTVETDVDVASSSVAENVVALDVQFNSTSVETVEWVSVKLLRKECKGAVPSQLFVEFVRSDSGFSSGKVKLTETGDVVECQLKERCSNSYSLKVTDEQGNTYPSMPSEITIMQGIAVGNAVLPYNIGIEVHDRSKRRDVFFPLEGLEKNKAMPAVGVAKGLYVPHQIKPGCPDDKMVIPVYQGEYDAAGYSAIHSDHVCTIEITGDDVSGLVPADSKLDVELKVDQSGIMKLAVTFHATGETYETDFDVPSRKSSTEKDIKDRLKEANQRMAALGRSSAISKEELADARQHLDYVNKNVEAEKGSDDGRMHLMQELRNAFLALEKVEDEHEWDAVEAELREEFTNLEKANNELGNQYDRQVNDLRQQVNSAINSKDVQEGREVLDEVRGLFVSVTMIYQLIGFVEHYSRNFNQTEWHNPALARQLLDKAVGIINARPTVDELHPLVCKIIDLMPGNNRPTI